MATDLQLFLSSLLTSAWEDGASLREDDLLAYEASRWNAGDPSLLACAACIHRRALFDAASEVLSDLRSAPQASAMRHSGAQRLSLLVQGMKRQRTAQLDLSAVVGQVLEALPAAGRRLPQPADGVFFPPFDNVGAIVRATWQRLAPEWRSFGEAEWQAAVRRPDEAEEEVDEEEDEEERAARAHALFWQGRQASLLTEEELHELLWRGLCERISPPWEAPPAGSLVPSPPKRLVLEGHEGGEAESTAEEEHEALGLAGHGAARWVCRVHYEDWLQALRALPTAKTAPLRSARFFLSFALDGHGRASMHALYAAACGVTQLLRTLCRLQLLDTRRAGRLDEGALETFVQVRSPARSPPDLPPIGPASTPCPRSARSPRDLPAGERRGGAPPRQPAAPAAGPLVLPLLRRALHAQAAAPPRPQADRRRGHRAAAALAAPR